MTLSSDSFDRGILLLAGTNPDNHAIRQFVGGGLVTTWVKGIGAGTGLETSSGSVSNNGPDNVPPAYHTAYIDTLVSDCDIRLDVIIDNQAGKSAGILFRYVDDNNFWSAQWAATGTQINLYKMATGTETLVTSSASVAALSGTLRVVLSGSTITIYTSQSSSSIITQTDSFNSTATNHGLQLRNNPAGSLNGSSMDNWIVNPTEIVAHTTVYIQPPVLPPPQIKSFVYLNRQQQIPELEQSIFYTTTPQPVPYKKLYAAVRKPEIIPPPNPGSDTDGRNIGVMTAATIQIQTVNPVVINPIGEFDLNTVIQIATPTFVERITACSTNTSVSVPTGATTVTITPPTTNTAVLTLKGNSGDTGIVLHPTQPTQLTLDPSQTTFIINASVSTNVTFTFI